MSWNEEKSVSRLGVERAESPLTSRDKTSGWRQGTGIPTACSKRGSALLTAALDGMNAGGAQAHNLVPDVLAPVGGGEGR